MQYPSTLILSLYNQARLFLEWCGHASAFHMWVKYQPPLITGRHLWENVFSDDLMFILSETSDGIIKWLSSIFFFFYPAHLYYPYTIIANHHYVVNSNPAHARYTRNNINVIKFLSDLLQIGGFSPGTPVSSTNKTDRHDITEILLKVGGKSIPFTHKYMIAHFPDLVRLLQ
jgi:hypothetical protein